MSRNTLPLVSCIVLLLLVAMTGLSACGGGSGGSSGSRPVAKPGNEVTITPPMNQAPTIVRSLEDITSPLASDAFRWESEPLTEYFSDPDGDTLRFTASTDNANVSSAAVSEAGALIVRISAPATAGITVTATDPGGATATQHFSVTVADTGPGMNPPVAPPATDHSDTQADAALIRLGHAVQGDFHSADDVDWLRLEVPEPGLVEFEFDAPAGSEITVFNADGTVLATRHTQSAITLLVPAFGTIWLRLVSSATIRSGAVWALKVGATTLTAYYVFRTASRITVQPGFEFEQDLEGDKECLARRAADVLEGDSDEPCKIGEINGTASAEILVNGISVGTLSIKADVVLVDVLCTAPQATVDVSVPVTVGGVELFNIPVPHTFHVPHFSVPVRIGRPHEEKCRPKKIPDGPELSISASPGESASTDLTRYIQDPREGNLEFSTVGDPDGVSIDGSLLTVRPSLNAETEEVNLGIRATSTRDDYVLYNDFMFRVLAECRFEVEFSDWGFVTPSAYLRTITEEHYLGECKDGVANGRGLYTGRNPQGQRVAYDGVWTDGNPRGRGTWELSLPEFGEVRYVGEWRGGQPNGDGFGTINLNGGNFWRYDGTWLRGIPHGQGEWSALDDGDIYHYQGAFQNGLQHGWGRETNTYSDGGTEILAGVFRYDELWEGTASRNGTSCVVSDGVERCYGF